MRLRFMRWKFARIIGYFVLCTISVIFFTGGKMKKISLGILTLFTLLMFVFANSWIAKWYKDGDVFLSYVQPMWEVNGKQMVIMALGLLMR